MYTHLKTCLNTQLMLLAVKNLHRLFISITNDMTRRKKNEFYLAIVLVVFGFIVTDVKPVNSLTLTPVPWVGVLLLKAHENVSEAGAGVILIKPHYAIGNARDIAKLKLFEPVLRDVTDVMFFTSFKKDWYAEIANFTLHPEYDKETLATIGLLELEYDDKKLQGNMLYWPSKINANTYKDNIFVFGYTDRNEMFEQIAYKMEQVTIKDCLEFYKKEKLDSKWMSPTQYYCYKVKNSKTACVFDAGMALVQKTRNEWTLVGMSAWSPGCALPTRFLDMDYFTPWLATQTAPKRRSGNEFFPYEKGWLNQDLDTWLLAKVNDTKYVLRPIKQPKTRIRDIEKDPRTEIVHGTCGSNQRQDGQLIYRDINRFESIVKGTKGVAVYALSFYDQRFHPKRYTCIMVFANCTSKSDSKLMYKTSFEQGHPLERYIKTHPVKSVRMTQTPFVYMAKDYWTDYTSDVINMNTTHLVFRFEFSSYAVIEVYFYGNRTEQVTFAPTTTREPNWRKITRAPWPYTTSTRDPPRFTRRLTTAKKPGKKAPPTTGSKLKLRPVNWWNRWWRYHYDHDFGHYDWWQG